MSEKILIRGIEAYDYPEVSRLVCTSFKWGAEREPYSPDQIDHYFTERGSVEAITEQFKEYQTLVAIKKKQIWGMVSIKDNEITKLYVDPEAFRLGIGRRLFEAAEDIIRKSGYPEIFLGSIFETSRPFYEAMGMLQTSEKTITTGPFKNATAKIFKKWGQWGY
jgi:ribosomal protein S18 acetylase RimI-like enzyme